MPRNTCPAIKICHLQAAVFERTGTARACMIRSETPVFTLGEKYTVRITQRAAVDRGLKAATHRHWRESTRMSTKPFSQDTKPISQAVQQFDEFPDSAAIPIADASAVSGRSRASIYRHFKAGELSLIKIGNSTRVRVGELRKLIGA